MRGIYLCREAKLLTIPNLLPFPAARVASSATMPPTTTGAEWPAKRVRDTFMKFFQDKNHAFWKSSPVVPLNDPTLLFANAGMLSYPIYHPYSLHLTRL